MHIDDDAGLAAMALAVRRGAVSAADLTQRALERIKRLNPRLGAFVAVDADRALAEAAALDAERDAGRLRGPLHGVAVAYKDLCLVQGLPARCGIADPRYFGHGECTVARRLAGAGAVALGKLAMTPLAMGTFGVNEIEGTPVNPWAPGCVPGGSSSGCGVALATRMIAGAVGTDTGGSIRLPAACCAVAGLKPTFGRVSRAGVMPVAPSLDHVGPMARRVEDVALLLSVMAGRHGRARWAIHGDVGTARPAGLKGVRLGLPRHDYFEDLSPQVDQALRDAARVLADLGAKVEPVEVPDPRPLVQASAVVVRAETSARHGRLLRDRGDALPEFVRQRLEAGLRVTAAEYLDAVAACARERRSFVRRVFAEVEALLVPAAPEPPPTLEEATGPAARVAERMASFARFARLFNALGIPVLALPCGFTEAGVPLGLQIAGRPFDDETVLRIGQAYEEAAGWHGRRPPGID